MGSAGTIWDTADVITKARMNQKTTFIGTGAEINAISPTYPGQLAFCTISGSGFDADTLYNRDAANTVWLTESSSIFGSGEDGSATDPALVGGNLKSYTNLTISSPTTWTGSGTIIVRVSGTFNLTSTLTLTNLDLVATGGAGGTQIASSGGAGGAGSTSRGTVIIIAKAVTGTGTITSTGVVGTVGANAAGTTNATGVAGTIGGGGKLFNLGYTQGTAGPGGTGIVDTALAGPTVAGTSFSTTKYDPFQAMSLFTSYATGGSGGGSGSGSAISYSHGGSGGTGGGVPFAVGGAGGRNGGHGNNGGSGGGGGGGGAPAFVILITPSLSAIVISLTGGAGGAGGNGTGTGYGGSGGGGGASAGCLKIADTDAGTTTMTGGAGGAAGTGTVAGEAGTAGTGAYMFMTWTVFLKLLKRGV